MSREDCLFWYCATGIVVVMGFLCWNFWPIRDFTADLLHSWKCTIVSFMKELVLQLRVWLEDSKPQCGPDRPTQKLNLSEGDSVMRIVYRDVVVPANPKLEQNTVETRVYVQVDGEDASMTPITGNGGKLDITVPEGSSGNVWYTYVDGSTKRNESDPSPKTPFVNADDQTPPDAPAGGLTLPKGDSIPD